MKLSEAIMLGSTMVKLEPATWLRTGNGKTTGCLCGMGYAAATGQKTGHFDEIVREWPWLNQTVEVPHKFQPFADEQKEYAFLIISEMAGEVSRRTITLEQAVEWIRSVEPEEEEEKHGKDHNQRRTQLEKNSGRAARRAVRAAQPELGERAALPGR